MSIFCKYHGCPFSARSLLTIFHPFASQRHPLLDPFIPSAAPPRAQYTRSTNESHEWSNHVQCPPPYHLRLIPHHRNFPNKCRPVSEQTATFVIIRSSNSSMFNTCLRLDTHPHNTSLPFPVPQRPVHVCDKPSIHPIFSSPMCLICPPLPPPTRNTQFRHVMPNPLSPPHAAGREDRYGVLRRHRYLRIRREERGGLLKRSRVAVFRRCTCM
ncbi:hypothetical protein EX30DRAFT_185180 [Ascodesmis nigricans]|uniref:Uncharacterized protein n=1 Tax=Ascodesmis nigricans TaxID=341454 RepID=A0A4S2N077_9PEZI|nr:hypothetical protein EX30DRAFT_185180 [Ascodesmis nigricans]